MPRRAILHIGPMKTGSTAIQYWLAVHRDALAAMGVHVPASTGRNMSFLTYLAQADTLGLERPAGEAAQMTALSAELSALPETIHSVAISGEMLGHGLQAEADVRALKALLDPFFDEYRVIVYLRRQDELSVSRFSTAVRRGEASARQLVGLLDYDVLLKAWSAGFGRDAIVPRIFERESMPDGDVVGDFAAAAGLTKSVNEIPLANRNPSLNAAAQTFLLMLAEKVGHTDFRDDFMGITGYDAIVKRLNQDFAGTGLMPQRAAALRFYNRVRASNERVRQAWFPERVTLFREDFDAYPEDGPTEASTEAVLDIALEVLVALTTGHEALVSPARGPLRRATVDDKREVHEARREAKRANRPPHQARPGSPQRLVPPPRPVPQARPMPQVPAVGRPPTNSQRPAPAKRAARDLPAKPDPVTTQLEVEAETMADAKIEKAERKRRRAARVARRTAPAPLGGDPATAASQPGKRSS